MTFPLRHTVTHIPCIGASHDMLGNTVPAFGDPVSREVYAVAPHIVEDGVGTSTEMEIADVDVYGPKFPVTVKDRFVIDGETFEVIAVQDWTRGFHGWEPGIVVELRRVT